MPNRTGLKTWKMTTNSAKIRRYLKSVKIKPVTALYQGVSSRLDDGPQWMIQKEAGSKMMESMYIIIASSGILPVLSKLIRPEKNIHAVEGSNKISARPGFFHASIKNPKKTTTFIK
jgi:hypothetical protein